jgi:hypothetical protein
MAAYTAAGALSSVSLGITLGLLGMSMLNGQRVVLWISFGLAIALLSRESGLLAFRIPTLSRQTPGVWGYALPAGAAAAMWGFDLGLVLTTRVSFSGAFLVLVLAFIVADPVFGAILVGAYWGGRATSIWIAPGFYGGPADVEELLDEIWRARDKFRRLHVWALVVSVLGIWFAAMRA